ncbi:hypothetical protein KIN20_001992 [Parelaphostrongylus tenuis]|uniref:Uncharacterized protein n=1 Tax=Parelaphostrongylus tenuis TaxID=148309 RepID=A0AAD5MDJ8_PARTN|nr:hypothetical protein KIN20_001992 [Parelaphostrongylus tenuis]
MGRRIGKARIIAVKIFECLYPNPTPLPFADLFEYVEFDEPGARVADRAKWKYFNKKVEELEAVKAHALKKERKRQRERERAKKIEQLETYQKRFENAASHKKREGRSSRLKELIESISLAEDHGTNF